MIRTTLAALLLASAAPAFAQDAAPVLTSIESYRAMAAGAESAPLFARELAAARKSVDAGIRAGIDVPVPKDRGGGPTHERHKANYKLIQQAGALYRLTGERRYADYVRDLLLAYAKLYPTLANHPAASDQVPGRLFWQSLNDSVWLVHAIQGYDAVRGRPDRGPLRRRQIDAVVGPGGRAVQHALCAPFTGHAKGRQRPVEAGPEVVAVATAGEALGLDRPARGEGGDQS